MKWLILICSLSVVSMCSTLAQERVAPVPKKAVAKKVDPAMKAKVDALVVKLGDKSFKVRRQAKKDLIELGKPACPYLEEYRTHSDVETRENVKEVLAKVNPHPNLDPSTAEPGFWRKRALKKGSPVKTVGEKKWLDAFVKAGGVVVKMGPAQDAATVERIEVLRAIEAKRRAEMEARAVLEAKKKAEAEALARARAIAAKKKAEAEAKAAAAKKKAEAEAAKEK